MRPKDTSSAGLYAAYILLLVLLANTLSYADRHLFAILMPAIKTEFAISDSLLGFIAGPGFVLSFVLLTIPLARLADQWSRRKVLAISAAVWSAATAMCGLATGAMTLTAARVVVGIGEAGGMPPAQAMVAQVFPARTRTTALGVLASSSYFGLVLGLAGGGALAAVYGWRATFLILAVPGFPLALLLWLTGPRRAAAVRPAKQVGDTMIRAVRECWAIPSLRLLGIGMGAFSVFGYAAGIWMPSYFIRSHGMTSAEAGAWLGIGCAIGGVLGSLSSGAIVDALCKYDERWQLRVPAIGFLAAFPLIVIALLLPFGASVDIFGARTPLVSVFAVVTSFLTSLWMGPAFAATARLVPPERRAQATALLIVVLNVMGSALGPLIAGGVSDLLTARFANEALRYSLLTMSIMCVVGAAIFWRAASHYPRDLAQRETAMAA